MAAGATTRPQVYVTGFIMVEQVKSIDFRSRNVKRLGHAPDPVLQEVLSILDACIY